MFGEYDPANYLTKKYKLKGWKAEAVEWGIGFIEAAIFYFIVLPLVLGTYPPAVVVQSCSMAGVYNVGDVVVLQGVSFDTLNAPEVTVPSLNYTIIPNNIYNQTVELVFSDGTRLPVQTSGDVILYESAISGEQIIHRAIAKVTTPNGRYVLTKGDANNLPDSVRLECEEWAQTADGIICTSIKKTVSSVCTDEDRGYSGCLGTPIPEDKLMGKAILWIPLIGHVKMLFTHVITLGHGYPGPLWC